MSVPGLYDPSPVQLEAHSFQPYDEVEVLYGGTAGCGKTLWLRWDPIETQWSGEHQRWIEGRKRGESFRSVGWALHVRREYPMLLQTILYMRDVAKRLDPGVHWDGDAKLLTFSCGFRYQFGHIQHEDDWRAFDSQDYTHLGIDEAIQTLAVQYQMLWSRVRTTDPILGKKLRTCLASNPDAPFEGKWVKERFVDPAQSGRKMLTETHELSDGTSKTTARIYIPARLADNPNAEYRRTYEAKLRQLPHHIMKARLFGDWSTVEGAFFEYEWIPDTHVVDPYRIPAHWTVYRVMDWGYKSPCPVLYWTVDDEGNIVVIDELNFNFKCREEDRKDAELVAIAIKKYEKAHDERVELEDAERNDGARSQRYWDKRGNCSNVIGPADYQIKGQSGHRGGTIEEIFAGYGIYWQACKKDRLQATSEFLRRLKDIPKSGNSRPGITIFSTCKETIRTIPLVQKGKDTDDTGKTREVPRDGGEDHWLDCLSYICMFRASPATKDDALSDDEDPFNEMAAARVRQRDRKWGYGS